MPQTCLIHDPNMFATCSKHNHNMSPTCLQHDTNMLQTCSKHNPNMSLAYTKHIPNVYLVFLIIDDDDDNDDDDDKKKTVSYEAAQASQRLAQPKNKSCCFGNQSKSRECTKKSTFYVWLKKHLFPCHFNLTKSLLFYLCKKCCFGKLLSRISRNCLPK